MSKMSCCGAIAVALWLAGPLGVRGQDESQVPPAAAPAERGYLGAVVDDHEDRGRGVRIERIVPGGPAEKAGLRKGDLITGVAGIRVRQIADFAGVLEQVAVGSTLTFEVLRGGKREKIDVTFGTRSGKAMPEPPAEDLRAPLDLRPPGSVPAAPKSPPPPPQPPKAAPSPKPVEIQGDDRTRLEMLERRLEQLERRIEQLERVVSKQFSQ